MASLINAGSKELSLQLPARLSPVKGVDAVALMAAVGEAASTAAQTSSEGAQTKRMHDEKHVFPIPIFVLIVQDNMVRGGLHR